jgi:hypothetical protein
MRRGAGGGAGRRSAGGAVRAAAAKRSLGQAHTHPLNNSRAAVRMCVSIPKYEQVARRKWRAQGCQLSERCRDEHSTEPHSQHSCAPALASCSASSNAAAAALPYDGAQGARRGVACHLLLRFDSSKEVRAAAGSARGGSHALRQVLERVFPRRRACAVVAWWRHAQSQPCSRAPLCALLRTPLRAAPLPCSWPAGAHDDRRGFHMRWRLLLRAALL